MTNPLSTTEELLNRLDVDLREEYEERAAIMQYEAGYHGITPNVWPCWTLSEGTLWP